jgi:hypothetical protein
MFVLSVLALLVLGAILGGAGLRRLGRWTGQAAGRWRPGVGVGAILLSFLGLVLAVRGGVLIGAPLLVMGLGLAVSARRRPGKAPPPGISEAEARSVLGVAPGATREEIQAAYLRLMQRAHPDHGGTSGLASQLNAARKRLLG